MQAIFACKMFRSHPNQAMIVSALQNPINIELVTQLREYLDEEYLTPEYFGESPNTSESLEDVELESQEPSDSSEGSPIAPVAPAPSGAAHEDSVPSDASESNKFLDDDIGNAAEGLEDFEDLDPVDDTSKPVEESTRIKASSLVDSTDTNIAPKLETAVGEIKGVLNLRQDTCGVVRVSCTNDELWIYYNDKINLNTVMSNVIEVLNATGYTYLDFNRLARTDNAIVFQINLVDTEHQVDPIGVSNAK